MLVMRFKVPIDSFLASCFSIYNTYNNLHSFWNLTDLSCSTQHTHSHTYLYGYTFTEAVQIRHLTQG
uniref:Uncharacterized protein n=1 Tax=Anguilla anguilla TaxID=7936 RepID=A0A0E9WP55_ANGAN